MSTLRRWHRDGGSHALRPSSGLGYLVAALGAAATLTVIVLVSSHASRTTRRPVMPAMRSMSPLPRARPTDNIVFMPPVALASLNMRQPLPSHFQRPEKPSRFPTASAREVLKAVAGIWSDGQTFLYIDAARQSATLRIDSLVIADGAPITVQDWTGPMLVADFGKNRFFLLMRARGLAISGAKIPVPLELNKADVFGMTQR